MDFRTIPQQSQKGEALHFLANNYALAKAEALAVGADASTDTFVVNAVTYELLSVETDTTADTAGGELNNTDEQSQVTIAGHGLAPGAILRCESEFLRVLAVPDANTVILQRGAFGSTIAAHADGQSIFRTATAPTVGTRTIPVSDIGTAANLAAEIVRAFDYHPDNTVITTIVGTTVFFIAADERFDLRVDDSGLTASTFTSFPAVPKGAAHGAVIVHEVTAGEAAAGVIHKVLGFAPSAVAYLFSDAGALVACDTDIAAAGRVVTLTEGIAPAWAAGDVFVIFAS